MMSQVCSHVTRYLYKLGGNKNLTSIFRLLYFELDQVVSGHTNVYLEK